MALPFDLNGTTLTIAGVALAIIAWLGYDLFLDRRFRHETGSAYGTSHWAKSRHLKQAGLFGADGIVLGRHHGKLLRHRTDKHLLTLAPNRAGKGVSAIIPNLLTYPGSVLVIDPKGENAIVTARRRREMGQAVHVLDPWGITGLDCGRFNPLLALVPDSLDLIEDAALLADGLVLPATKADDEFWNGEARSLIAGLLMHIVTTELPEDRHLGTLREILTLGEKEFAELLDDMIDNHAAHGLVARTARRLMQKTDRERSGVISTAQPPKLVCPSGVWNRGVDELRRRAGGRRESGAFLLGRTERGLRRIEMFLFYDDVDPHCFDRGIVEFDGRKFGTVWEQCRSRQMSVMADIHVHPGHFGQSESDRHNPMIAEVGHLALILPHFAAQRRTPGHIGVYEYLGGRQWLDHSRSGRKTFHVGWWPR